MAVDKNYLYKYKLYFYILLFHILIYDKQKKIFCAQVPEQDKRLKLTCHKLSFIEAYKPPKEEHITL